MIELQGSMEKGFGFMMSASQWRVCVCRSLREALRGEHCHPEKDHQEKDQSVSSWSRTVFQRNLPLLYEPHRALITGKPNLWEFWILYFVIIGHDVWRSSLGSSSCSWSPTVASLWRRPWSGRPTSGWTKSTFVSEWWAGTSCLPAPPRSTHRRRLKN